MLPLTEPEPARLAALAERTRRELDEAADLLLLAAAQGGGSALPALADRLEEIGHPGPAAKIRAAIEALGTKAPAPGETRAARRGSFTTTTPRTTATAMPSCRAATT